MNAIGKNEMEKIMNKLVPLLTLGICLSSSGWAQSLRPDHIRVRSESEGNSHPVSKFFFRRTIETKRRDGDEKRHGSSRFPHEIESLPLTISGYVLAIAIQEDGKIIIGGYFTSVNGIPRNSLARLNLDGSVDETWNPGGEFLIRTIIARGDDVYVGGDFRHMGGQRRNGLAKIGVSGTGAVDPLWNPNPDTPSCCSGGINAIAVSGTNLYVAGDFRVIGGQNIAKLAKLSTEGLGATDPNWNPNPLAVNVQSSVFALAVHGTNIFVGGSFYQIGGLERRGLAKLTAADIGAADPNWSPSVSGGFPGSISALAVDGTNLFAGGSFTRINGVTRTNLAKLSTAGAAELDMVWNPNAVGLISGSDYLGNVTAGTVYELAVSGTNLYVSGSLYSVGGLARTNLAKVSTTGAGEADPNCVPPAGVDSFGGLAASGDAVYAIGNIESPNGLRLNVARLDSLTGAPDESFAVVAGFPAGRVNALATQSDGKVIFGGRFDSVGPFARNNLGRLTAHGQLDPTWTPDPYGEVRAIAVNDSEVFIGGSFYRVGGQDKQWLAKIDVAGRGAVDSEWTAYLYSFDSYYFFNDGVQSLLLDGTNLFVGGSFDTVYSPSRTNSVSRPGVAKFSTFGAGQVDTVWTGEGLFAYAYFGGSVHVLELSGTNLFVGGEGLFFEDFVSDQYGFNLAKLSTLGSGRVDAEWRPNPTYVVSSLAVRDSELFVGGWFDSIGGASRTNLAKISTEGTGAADPAWQPNVIVDPRRFYYAPYYPVVALALRGNNLFVGGNFTNIGGFTRNNLAKVSATGTGEVDPAWQQDADSSVAALIAIGGEIYAGGSFTSIDGLARYGIASLPIAEAPVYIDRRSHAK